jgi:glycosyltransferase involved in cell wall biosynthesis
MANPAISVIVPVYNAGEFLAPCINSVLKQSFADFELILVDDASSDESLSYCQQIAKTDSRIRLIEKDLNEGVSAARNIALDIAVGSYVTFIDGDDLLHHQFLESLYSIAQSEDADVVTAKICRVEHNHSVSDKSVKIPPHKVYSPIHAIEMGLYQTVEFNSACAKLFRTSLFSDLRYRRVGYEDLDLFYRLFLKANKIVHLPCEFYMYRMHAASYTHIFTPERAVVLDVAERLVNYVHDNIPQILPAATDRYLSAAFNVFNLIVQNNASLPEIQQRCVNIIRKYRRASLLNPKVRFKNKIGIIITYIGGFKALKYTAQLHKNS